MSTSQNTNPNDAEFKILLVEDDSMYQNMLLKKFEKIGFFVEIAGNPMLGLQKIKSGQVRFDLIVTDIKMPGKSGIEFAKELRSISGYEKVPVVTITGYPDKEIISRAAGSGLNAILVKPFPFEKLAETILNILNKNSAA